MKIPPYPPKLEGIKFPGISDHNMAFAKKVNTKYLYWSEIKYLKRDPDGASIESLWYLCKLLRDSNAKEVKISDTRGFTFKYNLIEKIQPKLHLFDMNLGGKMQGEGIVPDEDRASYLISSIMEEAIASSQLEGAVTSRKIAKEMLRSERKPRNKSEQMIMNNYNTIKEVINLKGSKLTPDIIQTIHATITHLTLDSSTYEGKFRKTNDVNVVDVDTDEIVYRPPDFTLLSQLMDEFCAFANQSNKNTFIHPIIRASILHFLIGYIHPFVDGNGRTARAIFYWYLISQGYWLMEYMSISRMIIKSPAQYARAYLYSEFDQNDLTYFIIYQLKTMELAYTSLKAYISRKIKEKKSLLDFQRIESLNNRQSFIVKWISDDPTRKITIKEIQNRFGVVYQTARTDLSYLEKIGLIEKSVEGKKKLIYFSSINFTHVLQSLIKTSG